MNKNANAFDFMRLAAAFAVLFYHSYLLIGREPDEPLIRLTGWAANFGSVAVYTFFAFSGYLITKSWMKDPDLRRFMLRRALRIFPALAGVVIFCAFILGACLTTLPLGAYLTHPQTWAYLLKILVYPSAESLPGVFATNVDNNIVNGSLWTLRLELSLYFWVAFAGVTGLLRYRWANPVFGIACLAFTLIVPAIPALNSLPNMGVALVYSANLIPFFIGAWVVQYDFTAKQLARVTAVVLVIALVMILLQQSGLSVVVLVPFLALLFALGVSCDLSKYGDYSYGLYLWGYPIQQTIIHFWPTVNQWALFCLVLPLSAAFAFASWHLLEKKALLFKPKGLFAPKAG